MSFTDNFSTSEINRVLAIERARLCGREEEISLLEKALAEPCREDGTVYYFHGYSGIGKTWLCNYARLLSQKALAEGSKDRAKGWLYLKVTEQSDEIQTIREFYTTLSEASPKFTFPRYEVATRYLHMRTKKADFRLEERENKWEGKIARITLRTISTVLGPVNFGNLVLGALEEFMDEGLRLVKEKRFMERMESFFQRLDEMTVESIASQLTSYFVQDLNDSLAEIANFAEEEHNLIIILDAFEKRPRRASEDWFLKKLITQLKKSLWLIFGIDEKLPIQRDWDGRLVSCAVKMLRDDQLPGYLSQRGVTRKEDQEFIIKCAQGLPATVGILLMIYTEKGRFSKQSETESYQKLFEDYFRHHMGEIKQSLLQCLCLFDNWDFDVVRHVYRGEDCHEIFQELIGNAALVEKSQITRGMNDTYHLVDIVQKTLLTILLQEENRGRFLDANSLKFDYTSKKVNQLLIRLGKRVATYEEYIEFRFYCREAFHAAVWSYDTQEEFDAISGWCIKAETSMNDRNFYELEMELADFYLKEIQKQDQFRYDEPEKEQKMFRFRNMANRAWACRFAGSREKASVLAGEYYTEALRTMGINHLYTSFAFYRYGLTFRDSCDYATAEWLFRQCLIFSKNDNRKVGGLISPLSSVVNNVLGCLLMDLDKYEEAEKLLLKANEQRDKKDQGGLRTAHGNLSKLYFRWVQYTAMKPREPGEPRDTEEERKLIRTRLEQAREELERVRELLGTDPSNTWQRRLESKEVTLKLAMDRLQGCVGQGTPSWTEELKKLEDNIRMLEESKFKDAIPDIMAVKNNIAVIYAIKGERQKAYRLLSQCMEQKKRFYKVGEGKDSLMMKKPALKDTHHNLEKAKIYAENPHMQICPYDFILLY